MTLNEKAPLNHPSARNGLAASHSTPAWWPAWALFGYDGPEEVV
jgi:hypothetical protein